MANAQQVNEGAIDATPKTEEAKRVVEQQRQKRLRELQALNLQKENILSQRTSSPIRRAALEAALAEIEQQITALG